MFSFVVDSERPLEVDMMEVCRSVVLTSGRTTPAQGKAVQRREGMALAPWQDGYREEWKA